MKILLLGKTGQVGWELQRSLAPLGDVVALGSSDTAPWGDFRDPQRLAATVQALKPDVVVNAAAYTAVDRAEAEPELCRTVNALAPAALAQACSGVGALLVHYSTDYVFDGSGSRPWQERDPTGPLSVYGRTKLEGEQAIAAAHARHLIFRTGWVYAARGRNFAATMLKLAAERDTLRVVADQFGAPTGAELIADVTAHAIRTEAMQAPVCGTYHLAAAGVTSWHGYAQFVLAQAEAAGRALRAGPSAVQALSTAEFPTPAARPANSRLDCRHIESAFGLRMPPWEHGVARMLKEILTP